MARERVSTEQLKHDPLMDQFLKTTEWVKPRAKQIFIALGVIAAIIAIYFGYQWYSNSQAEKAGNAMAEAFKVQSAIVADPLPPPQPGVYAFKSEDEKNKKTIEAFEKVARDFPQSADVASYYAAITQLRVDAAKGEETLKRLAENTSIIGAMSRLTLAERYEATGKFNEALALYQKLKAAPGDLSLDLIEFNMARTYEALGKTQEASDLFFKVASQNREKPGAINTEALTRLTIIDPTRVEKLPEAKKEENPLGSRMVQPQ